MTHNSLVYSKAKAFAIRIVRLYRILTGERKQWILGKQLLRSGTSIGANISEANGCFSDADFSSKISIAYKEALETKYWLELMVETSILSHSQSIHQDADELARILFVILRSSNRVKPQKQRNVLPVVNC